MISKNTIKYIHSLHLKKNRKETGLFLVEGEKSVIELISSSFEIKNIYITDELFSVYKDILSPYEEILEIATTEELTKMGTLEHNDSILAVAYQKENTLLSLDEKIILALDDIRDPGNLGTIIRIADWYGITKIICSETTAELYNPKVIASSMGSFTRVSLFYTDLKEYLKKTHAPVIGAYMDGASVHTYTFPKRGILIMGNESNGISDELSSLITDAITIPRYGDAESLNVGIATAVILDNWKRN